VTDLPLSTTFLVTITMARSEAGGGLQTIEVTMAC
jgi:hypothetical protein